MPIYAYKCSGCSHQFDALQKVGDPLKVECPQCHQPSLVKQVTAAGFQLKGSGWYATDFRDKPAAKKEGKEGAPAAEGAAPPPSAVDSAVPPAPAVKPEKATDASAPPPAPAPAPSPPPAGSGGST